MHISSLVVVAMLAAHSVATPRSRHILHEKRENTPAQWMKRNRLAPHIILPMRVGLSQNQDALNNGYRYLMDVSDPRSINYGKHWTSEEVIEKFAPSNEAVTKVLEWLTSAGITENRITHSENKGWFAFDATTDEAEKLLRTEYHAYEHVSNGARLPACEEYHVPKHIQAHVDYITPGIKLHTIPTRTKKRRERRGIVGKKPAAPLFHNPEIPSPTSLATCDQYITPACVKALYQISDATKAAASNAMGIFEYGDIYDQADLILFFENFASMIPSGTHPTAYLIDGATAPVSQQDGGTESILDFSLAYPLIYPQNITLFQTDDAYYTSNFNYGDGLFNTFLDAIDGSYCTYTAFGETGDSPIDPTYPDPNPNGYKGSLMCGVYKPTNVISLSYNVQEADLPANYQKRQCNEYMKLGLQGTSIFFASGNNGVAGPIADGSNNGCLDSNETVFNPPFPATCPYVTTVGATKVYPGQTVSDPESVANDPFEDPYPEAYSSGGGFSNIYPIPYYQISAVAAYFANHVPTYPYYTFNQSVGANGGLYNRGGRGVPDVSANGDNIALYTNGEFTFNGGTSAATPIFASIVNLINEERIAAGKSPVGFINPVLYQNPGVLNDITNGTNPGCGVNGFPAVVGWDPSSGLGTPNYPKMLQLFLSLP